MDILERILKAKRDNVARAKSLTPLPSLMQRIAHRKPARSLRAALTASFPGTPRIIAECKRQSPSRGVMIEKYDPVALARAYESGGAAAISVLTDTPFFGGDLSHLTAVADVVGIPVMRKDFIFDSYQVYEARAAGADSFLLLAGVLDRSQLEELLTLGRQLGMEPLVESHTDAELAVACATSAGILGINNRNLRDFSIDLATGAAAVQRFKSQASKDPMNSDRIFVCESGIKSGDDLKAMVAAGFSAFLVGEALATSQDPSATLRSWLGNIP